MTRKVVLPLILTLTIPVLFCTRESPLELEKDVEQGLQVILFGVEPRVLAPGDTATVQVRVTDTSGAPVPGKTVRFSGEGGNVDPQLSVTDSLGIAATLFVAGPTTGEARVVARCEDSKPLTVSLRVDSSSTPLLELSAEPLRLLADGVSKVQLRALLREEDLTPRTGTPVTFRTNSGDVLGTALTDSQGVAETYALAPASHTDLEGVFVAEASGLRDTVRVLFLGVDFRAEAHPTHLMADGTSEATIAASVKETTSKVAVPDVLVTFATDLGTVAAQAQTDPAGVARVQLRAPTRPGRATVVATFGNALRDTVYVYFGDSSPAHLVLQASPAVLPADGQSTAEITATVTDSSNNPVPDGTIVHFELLSGNGTLESYKPTTGGVAATKLQSATEPGVAVIRASVGAVSDTVTVRYTVGGPAVINLVADSSSILADGVTTTLVRAYVYDAAGNPVEDGTPVSFTTDLGNITSRSQTQGGVAVASFSGTKTGVATIVASAGGAQGQTTVVLRPGPPNSVLLSFDPKSVGVKDSGRNQTLQITATVLDSRNNTVADGTYVRFEIVASPGGDESLSTYDPVPTVNGQAQVSFTAGTKSGPVRVRAIVTDSQGVPIQPEVRSTATEFLIYAGPPYIENIYAVSTSHLSVGSKPINVYGWGVVNNTVDIVVVVGDKYNNPVPPGTAVYFTTTGGVISTYTGFTDDEGVAHVTLHTGQPYPTVTRFYNTFNDPNLNSIIPGPAPDFDGDGWENDGIARVLAVTEGVDAEGRPAKVWSVCSVVFSGPITRFEVTVDRDTLYPGESALISIVVHDENGNPIVPGSKISAEAAAGKLSWTELTTDDPGRTRYYVTLTNNIDPTDPQAKPTATPVTIKIHSQNGNVQASTRPIQLLINRP